MGSPKGPSKRHYFRAGRDAKKRLDAQRRRSREAYKRMMERERKR